MGEIVNLRAKRKAKARVEKEATADANRIAFGRTKAERQTSERLSDIAVRRLEGHRLDTPNDE